MNNYNNNYFNRRLINSIGNSLKNVINENPDHEAFMQQVRERKQQRDQIQAERNEMRAEIEIGRAHV